MSHLFIDIPSYLNTHHRLKDAIEGLDEKQLKWKASPDKWSVTEVLSHLADHNLIVSFRIREILAGTTAVLPGFNQNNWVSGTNANNGAATDILDVFQALLVYNSLMFGRLSATDWEKSAVNFKGETVSLAVVVQSYIDHVGHHIGQIDRIKASFSLV